eukprot:6486600-Amphidinium_carterae.1
MVEWECHKESSRPYESGVPSLLLLENMQVLRMSLTDAVSACAVGQNNGWSCREHSGEGRDAARLAVALSCECVERTAVGHIAALTMQVCLPTNRAPEEALNSPQTSTNHVRPDTEFIHTWPRGTPCCFGFVFLATKCRRVLADTFWLYVTNGNENIYGHCLHRFCTAISLDNSSSSRSLLAMNEETLFLHKPHIGSSYVLCCSITGETVCLEEGVSQLGSTPEGEYFVQTNDEAKWVLDLLSDIPVPAPDEPHRLLVERADGSTMTLRDYHNEHLTLDLPVLQTGRADPLKIIIHSH